MARLPRQIEFEIVVTNQLVENPLENVSYISTYSPSSVDRVSELEKEINQMHALLNKLLPGSYGAVGGMTLAEKFEELLNSGPDWVNVKKEENK